MPASYETFRCAVETRDKFPKPDVLSVKILEAHESAKSKEGKVETNNVLYMKQIQNQPYVDRNLANSKQTKSRSGAVNRNISRKITKTNHKSKIRV